MGKRIIIDELEWEAPYGKIRAKSWHEETEGCVRVLALHGWMDNAGAYDRVVPLLEHPKGLYVVAPDLPGHGKSSQISPGSTYGDLTMMVEVRRVVKHLEWDLKSSNNNGTEGSNGENPAHKKFTILGHSFGAGLGAFYASLYPDEVDQVITIDLLKARTFSPLVLVKNFADTIDSFIETVPSVTLAGFNTPSSTPSSIRSGKGFDKGSVVVSYETAVMATVEAHAHLGKLSRDDAGCLLKRTTLPVSNPPNSVIFSRDLRLMSMINFREHIDVNKLMFAGIRCHFVAILGEDGFHSGKIACQVEDMDTVAKCLKDICKSYYVHWVDGDHYIHMNNAGEVAKVINIVLKEPGSLKSKNELLGDKKNTNS